MSVSYFNYTDAAGDRLSPPDSTERLLGRDESIDYYSQRFVDQEQRLVQYSMFLGCVTGCLVQTSTLGANFIMFLVWGSQIYLSMTLPMEAFAIAWSAALSTLACLSQFVFRDLLVMALTRKKNFGRKADDKDKHHIQEKKQINDAVDFLGFCFVAGTMFGINLGLLSIEIIFHPSDYKLGAVHVTVSTLWCFLVVSLAARERAQERQQQAASKVSTLLIELV
jgi:F0F1-type ATP synthase assembly protein I